MTAGRQNGSAGASPGAHHGRPGRWPGCRRPDIPRPARGLPAAVPGPVPGPVLSAVPGAVLSVVLAALLATMMAAIVPAAARSAETATPAETAGPLRVVATIPPAHAVLSAVLAGAGEVHLLIPGSASPHAYSLKPSDARALAGADLVLWVGPGLEAFLAPRLRDLAPRAEIVAWAGAPGMTLLPLRTADGWAGGHAHDHHGDEDGHDRAEGAHAHHADEHPDTDHAANAGAGQAAAIDPHLWLDPDNAIALAHHLAGVLSRLRPAQAQAFEAAARAYARRLAELDRALRTQLAPVAERPYLVFHDAFQYFERHYGLNGAGAITVSPEVMPGAARVRAVRARIREAGIVCVFIEPQFNPSIAHVIVEGTPARTATLDPLGALLPPGPGLYPGLLSGIARTMAGCLGARQ